MNDRSSLFGADGARMQWSETQSFAGAVFDAERRSRYTDDRLPHEFAALKARLRAVEQDCAQVRTWAYTTGALAVLLLAAMLATRVLL